MIKIKKMEPYRDTEKGSDRAFSTRDTGYIVVLHRNKGFVSGKHYHKGKSTSKSPEILYLVKGRIRIITKDIETGETEEHEASDNSLIEIPSGIYHEVHHLTDTIILELCTSEEDFKAQDTLNSQSNLEI
ncbi:MAG: hypothetical protein JSV92_05055 [archaeon]|nr:MAG: hypothetical protein JSV92_05055 [archaeon]